MKFISKKQIQGILEYCAIKIATIILFIPALFLLVILFLVDGDKNGPRTGYWRRKKGW